MGSKPVGDSDFPFVWHSLQNEHSIIIISIYKVSITRRYFVFTLNSADWRLPVISYFDNYKLKDELKAVLDTLVLFISRVTVDYNP